MVPQDIMSQSLEPVNVTSDAKEFANVVKLRLLTYDPKNGKIILNYLGEP